MLRKQILSRLAVIGLAGAMFAPAGAAAQQPSTANVLVPPSALASQAAQDAVANDHVANVLVPPATAATTTSATSADNGSDTGLVVGLASLALIAVAATGGLYLARLRRPRDAVA